MRTLQARYFDKSIYPKWVLQPQKSALRFFTGKYLQKFGGDFASPHTAEEPCNAHS
jgi:hypothetical protein